MSALHSAHWKFLFVSKMDSFNDVQEHESSAKRIKLDLNDSNIGELCYGDSFSCFSTTIPGSIDVNEGVSADCDSGYEASSTMESLPTPSHNTSPHADVGDIQETLSLSESFHQTPTYAADQLDTSQDSLDDNNASSTVSHISDLSGLSDLSGQDWKPMAGSMIWIQKQMQNGVNPRELLTDMGVEQEQIPQYVCDVTLWKLIINMLAEPPRRNKLRHVNTLDDVVRLLKGAQNIIVLTGAGVSVSCGIPDFRSRDGIYSRLAVDFPNLPDPEAMFDIFYFSQDPRPFFKFARDIYPGKFQPSPCHRFIKLLEKHRKLLRNYTQNIDTLEKEANIERVIECHGSFATASCTRCGHKVTADEIRETVLAQKIPLCPLCHPNGEKSVSTDELNLFLDPIASCSTTNTPINYRQLVSSGIMKPDIVFFGEGLPDTFHEAMADDKNQCDLLLVIGSSLKVRPVALIPSSLPSNVPQILINREPLPHCHFDIELLGDCDVIVNHLCQLLGTAWEEGVYNTQTLKELPLLPLEKPQQDDDSMNNDETEPNCTLLDDKLNSIDNNDVVCKCNTAQSTNTTSSLDDKECVCKCPSMSIITSKEREFGSIKERHMSIDSARDSGIGENSNFTDLETNDDTKMDDNKKELNVYESASTTDLRGLWQPKVKKSLADRLAPNSFHLIPPSRYIFPGAEVFYDPDESFHCPDDDDDDDEDDEELEEEENDSSTDSTESDSV